MRILSLAVLALGIAASPTRDDDAAFNNAARFMQEDGAALYGAICQGCHMPGGGGAVGAGAYPSLAGDPRLAVAGYPIALVLRGQKAMPGFGRMLTDEQIAAVLDYVRTHFGNDYPDKIDPAAVKAARQ
ncbi:MAG: cytochrome [Rhodospirillales bacterium]|jgi:mono/diheme cytochrome c family protein|nr:cytochrome [Rhodospirillales bacterium]